MKLQLKTEGLTGENLAFVEALNKKFNEQPEALDKDEAKALVQEVLNAEGEGTIKNILKIQGEQLSKINQQLTAHTDENPLEQFKQELKDAEKELSRIRTDKSGSKAFVIKTPAVTTTAGSVANQSFSAASLLRIGGDAPIFEIQRIDPQVLQFVSVGQTDAPALLWFEEIPKDGDFAVVAEGAVKPLMQYKFERRTADYKKVAGYTAITDEFTMDFPRLVSTIRRLMQRDCTNKMNSLILTDMTTAASTYSYPALALKIDNADRYAAIGAAVSQLQSLGYQPNFIAVNPADAWVMRLIKGTDGHYVMPPFTWNGQSYEFGKVIVDPSIAVGNFFLGDGNVYNVDMRGDIIVRIGYVNDDFIRNQYSLVVERYFYNYIPQSRKTGLIYTSYATVMTAIETA
jgi:HK97 family phage major capsid protein